jgi:hypothetical protein
LLLLAVSAPSPRTVTVKACAADAPVAEKFNDEGDAVIAAATAA